MTVSKLVHIKTYIAIIKNCLQILQSAMVQILYDHQVHLRLYEYIIVKQISRSTITQPWLDWACFYYLAMHGINYK